MKKYAICLILAATGCTSTVDEFGVRKGTNLNLEVDCNEQGARVRFGGSRDESEDQSGETVEVNPSKMKGG